MHQFFRKTFQPKRKNVNPSYTPVAARIRFRDAGDEIKYKQRLATDPHFALKRKFRGIHAGEGLSQDYFPTEDPMSETSANKPTTLSYHTPTGYEGTHPASYQRGPFMQEPLGVFPRRATTPFPAGGLRQDHTVPIPHDSGMQEQLIAGAFSDPEEFLESLKLQEPEKLLSSIDDFVPLADEGGADFYPDPVAQHSLMDLYDSHAQFHRSVHSSPETLLTEADYSDYAQLREGASIPSRPEDMETDSMVIEDAVLSAQTGLEPNPHVSIHSLEEKRHLAEIQASIDAIHSDFDSPCWEDFPSSVQEELLTGTTLEQYVEEPLPGEVGYLPDLATPSYDVPLSALEQQAQDAFTGELSGLDPVTPSSLEQQVQDTGPAPFGAVDPWEAWRKPSDPLYADPLQAMYPSNPFTPNI